MIDSRSFAKWIPGLVPGILFLCATCGFAGVSLELAADLFAEGQWAAARAESMRAAAEGVGPDVARARLLAALSSLRMGHEPTRAVEELEGLWRDVFVPSAVRCAAAYEAGLARRGDRDRTAAFEAFRFAYLNAVEPPLFWRAGCSLYFLLKADKPLRRAEAALWQSLQSCRDAWPLEIWRECRPRKAKGASLASLPGRAVVRFYRAQISPAIGARCDLHPSCSEYFLQASRARGLLGIPIMADRFVREPSVVAAQHQPITMPDGHVRFADPLSDHDFWMKGKR